MSSIVADVLQSTGNLAKENIVLKVSDLKRKLEGIKLEIFESLKKTYEDIHPLPCMKLNELRDQLEKFNVNYEELHHQIEKEIKPQMVHSVAEFHSVLEDLKKTQALKSVLLNLIPLHHHLEEAKGWISCGAHQNAAQSLKNFKKTYETLHSSYKQDIAIIQAMNTEFLATRDKFTMDLFSFWQKGIVISCNDLGKNKRNISLAIKEDPGKLGGILKAVETLNNLEIALKDFGKQFLDKICKSVIQQTVKISVSNFPLVLSIDILSEHSSSLCRVFEGLQQILGFVNENIFSHFIENETVEGEQAFPMQVLGRLISEEFCSLLILSLKKAVPKQSRQLAMFHQTVMDAENFNNFLLDIGFFSGSTNPLKDFINNVDTLPVNIMSQDILTRARSVMKKCLHQTVYVGVESLPTSNFDNSDLVKTQNGLSKATFSFPRCQISASMEELINLIVEVKNEMKDIEPNPVHRLIYVVRSICELYCSVVPIFHKKEIENIPQQTAIFHNNCMYLVHKLHGIRMLLESETGMPKIVPLADLIPQIKKLGTEAFLSQMRKQKQQLLQLIQEQQAYQTVMLGEGSITKAEKSLRQCLCQLTLLQKVWTNVLPSEVYFKAIGTLFNSVLEEIILRVVSMEDISADAAGQMDSIFAVLLKQGPDLFKIPNIDKRDSVHLYVKKWFKFQELQLVLSASLREIVDRWSSGKGPLSAHFSSDEVKHLIRALFQNTERRAAALAKIR